MTFTDTQVAALSAKLDCSNVKQNAKGFDHIEGWHAIAEANRIFGFDGWSREVMSLKSLHEPYQNENQNWAVSYSCTVRITVGSGADMRIRDGSGFGSGFDKQIGAAHESALKEAETDAMKRALMTFGNQFGLALYDKKKAEVQYGGPPERTDEQYVSDAIAWMKQQVDAATIHQAWTAEQDRYHSLPAPLQQKLMTGRDEALARFAPKPETAPADDWKLIGDTIKAEIDNALDTVAIRDLLESKQFLDLEAHSKTAGQFLRDRANKRAGTIAQSSRKAA